MATREEIEDAILLASEEGDDALVRELTAELEGLQAVEAAAAAAEPAVQPEQPRGEPATALEGVSMGIGDGFFGGAQLLTKGGELLGIPGFGGPQGLAASVSDYVAEREREYIAPEGFDWPRLGGNIVSPVNVIPGKAATGAAKAVGGSLLRKAAVGGAAGGAVGGAMTPAEDFGEEKVGQVVAGTALGAGLGAGGAKLAEGVQGAWTALQRLARTPSENEIQVTIQNSLSQQGIDWNALGADTQAYVSGLVRKALQTGEPPDAQAVANAATLRQAGIDNPTRGQVTQNPTQFGEELFLRNQEAGRPLADQYQTALAALNQQLRGIADGTAPPLDNPQAGNVIIQSLTEAARRGDSYEDALWGIAREQIGRDKALGNARNFGREVLRDLEDRNALQALPADIRRRIEQFRDGQSKLTVNTAENLKNALNQARENPVAKGAGQTNFALGQVRAELESVLDNATGLAQVRGAEFYRAARAASRDRRVLEQAVPALDDVRYGKTDPDDFLRKHVTGPQAKVADLASLRDFLLRSDPTAWQQIRGQVVASLQEAATKGRQNTFLPASYNQALRTLEKSGKLNILFNEGEVSNLQNIGKAGSLIEGPQGVPRTGLLGGARGAEALSRIVTVLGRFVPGGQFFMEPIAASVKVAPQRAATAKAFDVELPTVNTP